jgi:hypothetical protein
VDDGLPDPEPGSVQRLDSLSRNSLPAQTDTQLARAITAANALAANNTGNPVSQTKQILAVISSVLSGLPSGPNVQGIQDKVNGLIEHANEVALNTQTAGEGDAVSGPTGNNLIAQDVRAAAELIAAAVGMDCGCGGP